MCSEYTILAQDLDSAATHQNVAQIVTNVSTDNSDNIHYQCHTPEKYTTRQHRLLLNSNYIAGG